MNHSNMKHETWNNQIPLKTSENTVSSTSVGREGTGGRGEGVVVKNEVRREERWAAKSVPAPAISATESVGTGPGVSEEKTSFL